MLYRWENWPTRLSLRKQRKVRAPLGSTRANGPPPQGEEQWNRENVQGIEPDAGNGRIRGAAGVKTAKLCAEQDQIGGQRIRKNAIGAQPRLSGRLLEAVSNGGPRGMIALDRTRLNG
jgi:hypothetical protein